MTAASPDLFFHHAYDRKRVIWRWLPEAGQQPVAIAEFDGMLRELRDGRFIAVEGKEFGIVSCPTDDPPGAPGSDRDGKQPQAPR